MDKPLRFLQLSAPRRHLVRLCQSTNYGHLQDLAIEFHEPILSPESVVLVDVRLDSEDTARRELALGDFVLCREICRLMSVLDQVGNGKISRLEVRAGIPRRIILERQVEELGLVER